jgi:hypothetical protein
MIEIAVTIVCNFAVAIFVYGRLTERVKVHTEQIKVLDGTSERHEGEIGQLYGLAGVSRPPIDQPLPSARSASR